ncbi:50S ribosomal protein L25/general stress protein Ctc [Nordella sp. HKS 07]|uniref:50S ribosomal protein L25/general stress protein Ctc n=1 Tax=Nordella sp. HKS 07 TaxID=2712222 RepID=UPI0013E111BD|nr:50S ribosomal protein L25/general stress protein Ctc [Nordella sp. HKS 07]QIG46481.1 50S ribosomal protein L25/general stress protein Ctc [Nordella sp. HKS 07]
MSKIIKLQATARGRAGKGAARAVRREGRIPGVVYGDKKEPQNISFAYNELLPHVNTGRFMSTLVDLEVDGAVVRAIPRDIQFEPVRDFITHVDFLRLGKNARILVEVPVHFTNHAESPGIKKGAVLNIVSHEIGLYCPADFIPDQIVVDLTGLEIGQSVHISAIKLPENVTPAARERDLTIATIAAPAGLKEEETAAAEAPAAEVPATAQKAPPAAPGAAPAAGKDAKAAAAPAAKAGDKKK